jgi:hypothetical protein
MTEGRVRWGATWIGAALIALIVVACSSSPPRPPGTFADLVQWDGSSTYSEEGDLLVATYDDWPMRGVPFAYACIKPPKAVFGADPQGIVLGDDPNCAGVASHFDGGSTLTVSIDRAALPEQFAGLDAWPLVLAMTTQEGNWSISKPVPASFDDFLPRVNGSAPPAP